VTPRPTLTTEQVVADRYQQAARLDLARRQITRLEEDLVALNAQLDRAERDLAAARRFITHLRKDTTR